MKFLHKIRDEIKKKHKKSDTIVIKYIDNWNENEHGITSDKKKDENQYEIVEKEILPKKIICPDCGGVTLEGLDYCDKCGGELIVH